MTNKWVGKCKRKILIGLQKKYGINDWHVQPVNDRPYAIDTINSIQAYIDKTSAKTVVEIGCGLGSIIGNLDMPIRKGKRPLRIAYDINGNNLKLGKRLHPNVIFQEGSFDKVSVRGEIDCLIMINFIHNIPELTLRMEIQNLLKKNTVKLFVFDTFNKTDDSLYRYSHKGEYLLGENYKLVKKSKGFLAANRTRRYVEYWEKVGK